MAILIRSIEQLDDELAGLVARARQAFAGSAPPPGVPAAGAALLGANGAVFVGSTVRSGAGRTVCAESAATAAAREAGTPVHDAAFVCDRSAFGRDRPHGAFPCGRCRQDLADLADDAGREIACYVTDPMLTAIVLVTSGELMPDVLSPLPLRHLPVVAPAGGG